MYPVHRSKGGSFQELARKDDVTFGQLSLLRIDPGAKRGYHYHKRKKEWFCCIRGKCKLVTHNVNSLLDNFCFLKASDKEFVGVHCFESHYLENVGNEICEILIIISEEYDESDPDTWPLAF